MFRVVFKSLDASRQKLIKECGPWLPRREDAQAWADYFNDRGHHIPAEVESSENRFSGQSQ